MEVLSELVYKTLDDRKLRAVIDTLGHTDFMSGGWIAGGAARKAWYNLDWSDQDVDYFFANEQQYQSFNESIESKSKKYEVEFGIPSTIDNGIWSGAHTATTTAVELKPIKSVTCYSTDNANTYTFSDIELAAGTYDITDDTHSLKIQAIKKYYPSSLRELFATFDFTVCQFATDGKILVATKAAIEDCDLNRLVMVPDTPRKATALRILKYATYGFNPSDNMMSDALNRLVNNEEDMINDQY